MEEPAPKCNAHDHARASNLRPSQALERAAQVLRAMGDASRLRILDLLKDRELCVTEIVEAMGQKFATVSQRLKLLRTEGLIVRRRSGNHIHYALADRHVVDLILNALAHANEIDAGSAQFSHAGEINMANHHEDHTHKHGPDCGHIGIVHEGHVDYLHDGHLHHQEGSVVDEHQLAVSAANPDACTPKHDCGSHEKGHQHGPNCGHAAVPHGDHVDYLVNGHLHHPHGDHCDDHGKVKRG